MRKAFTLIELLVVIAILAVLIGLLLPAVGSIRETGNRTACVARLRQIALAAHTHGSTTGYYPMPGSLASPYPSPASRRFPAAPSPKSSMAPYVGPLQPWSWAYQILPYMDQDALWRLPDDTALLGQAVELFVCPSRRGVAIHNKRFLGDYAWNGGYFIGLPAAALPSNGMIDPAGVIRLDGIRDGASNTLMVAEKFVPALEYAGGAVGDRDGVWSFYNADTVRYADLPPFRDHSPNKPLTMKDVQTGNGPFTYPFGSAHPHGVRAAFADASVRTIRYSIDIKIFQAAAGRQDRTPFSMDDL